MADRKATSQERAPSRGRLQSGFGLPSAEALGNPSSLVSAHNGRPSVHETSGASSRAILPTTLSSNPGRSARSGPETHPRVQSLPDATATASQTAPPTSGTIREDNTLSDRITALEVEMQRSRENQDDFVHAMKEIGQIIEHRLRLSYQHAMPDAPTENPVQYDDENKSAGSQSQFHGSISMETMSRIASPSEISHDGSATPCHQQSHQCQSSDVANEDKTTPCCPVSCHCRKVDEDVSRRLEGSVDDLAKLVATLNEHCHSHKGLSVADTATRLGNADNTSIQTDAIGNDISEDAAQHANKNVNDAASANNHPSEEERMSETESSDKASQTRFEHVYQRNRGQGLKEVYAWNEAQRRVWYDERLRELGITDEDLDSYPMPDPSLFDDGEQQQTDEEGTKSDPEALRRSENQANPVVEGNDDLYADPFDDDDCLSDCDHALIEGVNDFPPLSDWDDQMREDSIPAEKAEQTSSQTNEPAVSEPLPGVRGDEMTTESDAKDELEIGEEQGKKEPLSNKKQKKREREKKRKARLAEEAGSAKVKGDEEGTGDDEHGVESSHDDGEDPADAGAE